MFEGFEERRIQTSGPEIYLRMAGSGPALLLIHGYPQNHACWHAVAPKLAERFTVVVPDLRGYGASGRPADDAGHTVYAKRAMASDLAEVMTALGFEKFQVVGHDRGARVGYRLCLDHPERVTKFCSLDVVPTLHMWDTIDKTRALGAFHWTFL
ncbi:MAG: alpha/beta hydrolase, partial [Rhodospirillaceae bacterium]